MQQDLKQYFKNYFINKLNHDKAIYRKKQALKRKEYLKANNLLILNNYYVNEPNEILKEMERDQFIEDRELLRIDNILYEIDKTIKIKNFFIRP